MTEITIEPILIDSKTSLNTTLVVVKKTAGILNGQAALQVTKVFQYKIIQSEMSSSSSAVLNESKYKVISAKLESQSSLEAYTYDREIGVQIKEYIPSFYEEFEDVQAMMRTTANEAVRLNAKLDELLDQFFVDSATYSLEKWNDFVQTSGISKEQLRERVKQKLKGVDTVTTELIKNVVDQYVESEVTENNPEEEINIRLIGKRGEPEDFKEIEKAIDDIIPAHLQGNFLFTYLTWGEVTEAQLEWQEADTYTAKGLEAAYLLERS